MEWEILKFAEENCNISPDIGRWENELFSGNFKKEKRIFKEQTNVLNMKDSDAGLAILD